MTESTDLTTPAEELDPRSPAIGFTAASVKRRFLRGSAWQLSGKVITTVLGLLINALIARLLAPSEVGAFFTVFTMVAIGSTLAQLGLDRALVRLVSASIATGDPGKARRVIEKTFLVGGVAAVVLAVVLLLGLGSWLATNVLDAPLVVAVIPIAAGWLVATALRSLVVETFRGMQRFNMATLFDVLLVDVLVASIVSALWLLHTDPTLEQIVTVFTAVSGVVLLVGAALLFGRVRELPSGGVAPSREIVAIAWPLLITNVATYLLGTGIDVLVLGAFRAQREVAVYAAASRLMFLVVTPFLVFQGVVAPIVAELAAKGRMRQLERTLRAVATLAGIPAFVALMLFLVFGGSIMGFLYGPFYRQGATMLFVLCLGRLVAVYTGSCAVTLMMTGHQRAVMYITVGFGIASLGAGIALAGPFGGVGIAVATATFASLQNLTTMYTAKRLVGVRTQAYLSLRPLIAFLRKDGDAADEDPE
jgi:O-antigen/teichoic acid export membrane protein